MQLRGLVCMYDCNLVICQLSCHQERDERRQAQAAVAANAKTLLRKETEWMRRQPKARCAAVLSQPQIC